MDLFLFFFLPRRARELRVFSDCRAFDWFIYSHNESLSGNGSLNMLTIARWHLWLSVCVCVYVHGVTHPRPVDRFMIRLAGQRSRLLFTDFFQLTDVLFSVGCVTLPRRPRTPALDPSGNDFIFETGLCVNTYWDLALFTLTQFFPPRK